MAFVVFKESINFPEESFQYMRKALVTIAIGERFLKHWEKYCKKGWEQYAARHGYDLIVFDELIDKSELGTSRSPAWQKCLILNDEKVKQYDRIVWLDADVVINHFAPDIISFVPYTRIGGTDSHSFYTKDTYRMLNDMRIAYWKKNSINAVPNQSGREYYTQFGIDTILDDVMQTGVLVMTPALHNDLFLNVYYNYEEKPGSHWNYEMRPLSYEIVKNDLHYFIDDKFNYIFSLFKLAFYPETLRRRNPFVYRWMRRFRLSSGPKQLRKAATIAYCNSYFLHFAGCGGEIKFIDTLLQDAPVPRPSIDVDVRHEAVV